MFVVYVLYSASYDKIYIGFTSDLINRFKGHQQLSNKGFTIKFRPWVVIHVEVFETKKAAMSREKQLKTASGRDFIRKNILPLYKQ